MPKFKVLVQRDVHHTRYFSEEKWFTIVAEDEDEAKELAEAEEVADWEKDNIEDGWTETSESYENDEEVDDVCILKVEEIPEGRIPDAPGQMKMFEVD